jgi:anti-sigma regulatory factor (Ser/Thr protein kinase)
MTPHWPFGATPWVLWRWTRHTPDGSGQARGALRGALHRIGFDSEAVSDAVLAASEFIANATEHAVGPYEMRLRHSDSKIICEVEDHDPRIPEIPVFTATSPYALLEEICEDGCDALDRLPERGRGLHIVHELSKGAWGFRSEGKTKTAWLALTVPWLLTGDGAEKAMAEQLESSG